MHESKPKTVFLKLIMLKLHCYTTGTSGIYVGTLPFRRRKELKFTVSGEGPAGILVDLSRTFRLGKGLYGVLN